MKTKKKTLLIILVFAGILAGCKKYEEGPLISFRSAWHRLEGKHTLIKYTVDGVDSLNSFYDSLGLTFEFIYSLADDGRCFLQIIGPRKDGKEFQYLRWNFDWGNKKKTQIILKPHEWSYNVGAGPFKLFKNGSADVSWDILRLKKNDIHMRTNYNGKEYYIELN